MLSAFQYYKKNAESVDVKHNQNMVTATGSDKTKKKKRKHKKKTDVQPTPSNSANVSAKLTENTEKKKRKQEKNKRRKMKKKQELASKFSTSSPHTNGVKSDVPLKAEKKDKKKSQPPKGSPVVDRKSSLKRPLSPPEKASKRSKLDLAEVVDESSEDEEDVTWEEGMSAEDLSVEMDGIVDPPIDPMLEAKELLQLIIHPKTIEEFNSTYWEKKPLYIPRCDEDYYADWLRTADLDEIFLNNRVMFTEHLDVTSYKDGKRETHNPVGRAYASVVWDFFQMGCSVRMLCPQAFHQPLAEKLNLLQELFGCFVGSNAYLTPPKSQGFAPHYDDIEAFVLQVEGRKRWRVYAPRSKREELPQYSSGNFSQDEIGKPIMEVVLEPGDMLYFPRGFIHQADVQDDSHSLHLTISTYQKHTWGDLLKRLLPLAVDRAMKEDVDFRRGLPIGCLNYMGEAYRGIKDTTTKKKQTAFEEMLKSTMNRLQRYLPVNEACDEMGQALIHDSLPPMLDASEATCHASLQGEYWNSSKGRVCNVVEVSPDTKIRIPRWSCLRLTTTQAEEEEGLARVHHSLNNTAIYHEVESQYHGIAKEAIPALKLLIQKYPDYVMVEELPLDSLEEKLEIATTLYEMGLVMTRENLESAFDDDTSEDDSQ